MKLTAYNYLTSEEPTIFEGKEAEDIITKSIEDFLEDVEQDNWDIDEARAFRPILEELLEDGYLEGKYPLETFYKDAVFWVIEGEYYPPKELIERIKEDKDLIW